MTDFTEPTIEAQAGLNGLHNAQGDDSPSTASVPDLVPETGDVSLVPGTDGTQQIGVSWSELSQTHYEPPVWLVDGLLCPGFWVLSGKPKDGKSLLGLSLAVSVAAGSPLFGEVRVQQAGAAIVSYEDHISLIQERLGSMIPEGTDCGNSLHVICDIPALDDGGFELLEVFCASNPTYKLLIIDTLMQGLSPDRRHSTYGRDLEIGNRFQNFALKHGVVLIAVHHSRKGHFVDLADSVRGTLGLTGSAFGYLVLESNPKDDQVYTLKVKGKRARYQEFHLSLDDATGHWQRIAEPGHATVGAKRRMIAEILSDDDRDFSIEEILELLAEQGIESTYGSLKKMLILMAQADPPEIERSERGRYRAVRKGTGKIVAFPGAQDDDDGEGA